MQPSLRTSPGGGTPLREGLPAARIHGHDGRVSAIPVRWVSPALVAVVATLVVLGTPDLAAAEGPGYDGRTGDLVLKWQDEKPGQAADNSSGLKVFGRGFRGGSKVTLRVGSGIEKTGMADTTGAVSLVVDAGAHPGSTIVAVGQTPSGSAWTLVGYVPAAQASGGPQSYVTPVVLALAGVAFLGGLIRRPKRRGRVPVGRAP